MRPELTHKAGQSLEFAEKNKQACLAYAKKSSFLAM